MKNINKEKLHNLFEEIAAKNESGFNQLYDKYFNLVYSIAFSIIKNKNDSEDVAQKVFFKIWRMKESSFPSQNESSWLYSVTKNEALNFLRSQKKDVNIDDLYYISKEDKEINEIIEMETYNKIIQKLNIQEQEIVSLKILSKLSFEQISQVLNIPTGTVKWKYYKSINNLKLLLGNIGITIITFMLIVKSIIDRKEQKKNIEYSIESNVEKVDKLEQIDNKENFNNFSINEEYQNITVDEPSIYTVTPYEIGFIGIISVIFIICIIFLIKFQLKPKRKVSK